MKERYTKRPITDAQSVQDFVAKGIPQNIAEAMSARGITSANFDTYFGDDCFHSPFEMKNMQEAVETISYVLEGGGSVLIYGDYDADGLTASSILSLFFTDNGVDNDVIIPTRDDGYGVHADLVFKAFEKKFYDLIVTVDCGIANAEEIDKIIDQLGVEIVVTDHHELKDPLPNCLCVNPKMGYPFANLAGAGVAWKLVEALAGRETAAKYSALAALGTIGDIMEMADENRSLVKLGLQNCNHKGLMKLAETLKCSQTLTATEVSMKIAPKINAAGRMGNPQAALELLLSRDQVDTAVVANLLELNEMRKEVLDQLVRQADAMCDVDKIRAERLVFLHGENWSHGILGIAAARYKEKYRFPAVVMAKNEDGLYVGSARGTDGIDLFELFTKCDDLLDKFGGHKVSVGFSVSEENLQTLNKRLVQLLAEMPDSCFSQSLYYDIELENGCIVADLYEFTQKLQPYLPQDKVIFKVHDVVKFANSFGKEQAHMTVALSGGLELTGFNCAKYVPFIKNGADVEALISLEMNDYSHTLCGIIEDMHILNSVCFDEFYKLNFLRNFRPQHMQYLSEKDVPKLLAGNSVLAVFDDYETYLQEAEKYNLDDFYVDIFFDNSLEQKTVAVSPLADYDFSKYKTVVYFCKENMARPLPSNAVYVKVNEANSQLYALQLDRNVCATVYSALKRKSKYDSIKGVYDKYLMGKVEYAQYIVALRIFQELNFIQTGTDPYTLEFLQTEKSDLANSALFRCFANIQ